MSVFLTLPHYPANLGWIHYQLEQKNEFLSFNLIEMIVFTFHESSFHVFVENI